MNSPFLPFLALILALSTLTLHAAKQPNIIVIITDDQGYPPLAAHGHPWIRTPHLDRLYRESTRLTRFLVSPTCSPTRSALMTGRHPMRNGVTHTILERERMTLKAVTLPQALQKESGRSSRRLLLFPSPAGQAHHLAGPLPRHTPSPLGDRHRSEH